jgi:hypothetical protein
MAPSHNEFYTIAHPLRHLNNGTKNNPNSLTNVYTISRVLTVMRNRETMVKLITIILVSLLNIVTIQSVIAERTGNFTELKILQKIIEQDAEQFDFANIKLSIDKLIDPAIDIESELQKINKMVTDIQSMLPSNASAMKKCLLSKDIFTNKVSGIIIKHTSMILMIRWEQK